MRQIEHPRAHQRRPHARRQPEPHRAPEAQREQRKEIRDFEREGADAEDWHCRHGGQVAHGQDLGTETPGFDEQGQELYGDGGGEHGADGVEEGGKRRGGDVAVKRGGEGRCLVFYFVGELGGGGREGQGAREVEGGAGGAR